MLKRKDGLDLPKPIREAIINKFNECIENAEKFFKKELDPIKLQFGVSGSNAGKAKTARVSGGYEYTVMLNSTYILTEFDDMLSDTIPHEIAHIIVRQIWPKRCKPHGDEWKFVMAAVFKLNPKRCHSYSHQKVEILKRSMK